MTQSSACFSTRHTLSALRDRIGDCPEVVMALEGMIEVEAEHFPDPSLHAALLHATQCAACQAWSATWLDAQFPQQAQQRERVARYCCFSMFEAVTQPKVPVRLVFELFRGEEPTWYLDDLATCVRFCPWCGQRLPDYPFEPDAQQAR